MSNTTRTNERHDMRKVSLAESPATLAEQPEAALQLAEGPTLGANTRKLLVMLGSLFVCLGIIGIALPLVPTTPFLLLDAACYAKSSEKYHNWLLNHKWFGEYLRNYQAGKGIPVRVKVSMLIFLWTTIGLSAAFVIDILWVRILLMVIATAVTVHMYCLPAFRPEK